MFNFAEYVKILKKNTKKKVSNEVFVNDLIGDLVANGNVRDKNGETLYLNKDRVSNLINNREDIQNSLKKALEIYDIEKCVRKDIVGFIEEYFEEYQISKVADEIKRLINNDENICKAVKNDIIEQSELSVILTKSLFLAIKTNNRIQTISEKVIEKGSFYVDILENDLFKFGFGNRKKNKNIVVIPVETSFETHVTRKYEGVSKPLVSENSIHGQWLTRWEKSGESIVKLKNRIKKSLSSNGFIPNKGKYSIGDIAVIENENAIYYLLAISEFDSNNNAHSSKEKIKNAIVSLLQFFDRNGQGNDLYIPLLGTGLSRTGLGIKESKNLIITCLKENIEKINGNIHIVIKK